MLLICILPWWHLATYLVLGGFLGINAKFGAGALGLQFSTGLLCWLHPSSPSWGHTAPVRQGNVLVLGMVTYGIYTVIAAPVIVLGVMIWHCVSCVLNFAEVSPWERSWWRPSDSRVETSGNALEQEDKFYHLPSMTVSQIPPLFWHLKSLCYNPDESKIS